MKEEKKPDIKAAPGADSKSEEKKDDDGSSQNPIKKELDKVKKPRSKREQLEYTKKRVEQQLADLSDDDDSEPVLDDEEDENRPLTLKDLKTIEKKKAQETALTLADDIEDEDERNLTKHYLKTRILPSGNPTQDLKDARALVNSVKNSEIAIEAKRKRAPSRIISSGGAPAKEEENFEATDMELRLAATAGKKTPDQIKAFILKARKNEKAARGE